MIAILSPMIGSFLAAWWRLAEAGCKYPNNHTEFCKGYYARISPTEMQMKGRATRLFVTPFVEALTRVMHRNDHHELEDFFRYHRAFRYPLLAGEFSFLTRLGKAFNVAYDWGLEDVPY